MKIMVLGVQLMELTVTQLELNTQFWRIIVGVRNSLKVLFNNIVQLGGIIDDLSSINVH